MALTNTNRNTWSDTLAANTNPHTAQLYVLSSVISSMPGCAGIVHPPKNNSVDIVLIISMLPYSAINDNAKNTAEYSTL